MFSLKKKIIEQQFSFAIGYAELTILQCVFLDVE